MKNWIKEKLISLLGVDLLEEKLIEDNKKLNYKLEKLELLNEKVIKENNFIMKQFNISADINHYENQSWAVISIKGKPEYVKFVNLSNQDMRIIHDFLKNFERTNRIVDTPFHF